jgi:formylglycine-generating enzyme required for sulfatase activity
MRRFVLICIPLAFALLACSGDGVLDSRSESSVEATAKRGGQPKVSICHWDDDTGEYKLISVAGPAQEAHMRHGDEAAGGDVLDEDCEPQFSDIVVITPTGTTHELVIVPAGSFVMGSDVGATIEQPVHTVTLDGFYVDKYEVTNALWNSFAQATGRPGKSAADNHPVVWVNWHDATAYCGWAGLRLPTEAEWEKAARGTDGQTYPWGEGIDGSKANYINSGDPFDNGTSPVGYFVDGISPYGAYDMTGNVLEWVADWYDGNYYSSSPAVNPIGPTSTGYKVMRGGGWTWPVEWMRAAQRVRVGPWVSYAEAGFRCAQDE